MKQFEDFVKEVERDLVIGLTVSNRSKKITLDEAKVISKDFVSSFPFENYEDLFGKLLILSNKHRIIRKVYVKHAPGYFEAKKEFVLKNFRQALKENDLDKALNVSRRVYHAGN
jgi:hypothetical protein